MLVVLSQKKMLWLKLFEPSRSWADPQAREWTKYLLHHHKCSYPDIQYHFDWSDTTVNAYAWVDNSGQRHIAILGGLVQHYALKLEGIALVTAHEIAHHYGGLPTHSSGLSCEGQSDYAGVREVMREVWFGEQYVKTTREAIKQMADFFHVPDSPDIPEGTGACNHPDGACRIATYYTALTLLHDKPKCAGPIINNDIQDNLHMQQHTEEIQKEDYNHQQFNTHEEL